MNVAKLRNHIKLCRRNLRTNRVECCAECPFEQEITKHYPDLKVAFEYKRAGFEWKG